MSDHESETSRPFWTRRTVITGAVTGGLALVFADDLAGAIREDTAPIVEGVVNKARKVLGGKEYAIKVFEIESLAGTVPSGLWNEWRQNPVVADPGNPDYASCFSDIVVNLSAKTPLVYTGIRFRERSVRPIGDRQIAGFVGGGCCGDDTPAHAWVGMQDGKTTIVYGADREPSARINLSTSRKEPTTLEITLVVLDPVIVEWDADLLVQDSQGERYRIKTGPFTSSGIPEASLPTLSVDGDWSEVQEYKGSSFEKLAPFYVQQVFG